MSILIQLTLMISSHVSNGLAMIKMKRKLEYRSHESVCPYLVNQLLQYLKLNNEFYSGIEVDISHIPSSLVEVINV